MNQRSMARLFGYWTIALALLGTAGINLYTVAQIRRARTSVPWVDQWIAVQELARYESGKPLWPILWSSYWGHRLVIPRLLFFADARWFALASQTWLTLLLQLVHVGLLIALAWRLMGRRSPPAFLVAVAVILNLMLSPFQMENFVWSMQTMFPMVYVAATAAILCLSRSGVSRRGPFLALSIALGLTGSYTMPNGLLIWPVLVSQAIWSRAHRRVVLGLAAIGTAVVVSYLWRYTRPPELGMGVGGILRHPIDAIRILGLILGCPFRLSIPVSAAAGIVVLAATGYICIGTFSSSSRAQPWSAALFSILLFLFLSSVSLAAGRLTPAFLHLDTRDPLPSKYFTLICESWAAIAMLVLYACWSQRVRVGFLCFYGVLFGCLMFATVRRQLVEASDWADVFLGADAVGSAFLLDAPDEQLLSVLGPTKANREERVAFLKQHRLAMFHDPRAQWPGRLVSDLFPPPAGRCIGAIEKTVRLSGSSWRVTGWAWDIDTASSPDDILFAGADGRIVGMARGGLRHGYMPGFLFEPGAVPASHARFRDSEWLGYVRQEGGITWEEIRLYGVLRSKRGACEVR